MRKTDIAQVNKMEELADNGHLPLKNIESLSATDLRAMVYVLIERIKRIEKATEEKAQEYTRRLEGLPEAYVSKVLYDKDIKAIEDDIEDISVWKENTRGSANTRAAVVNLIVAVFGGAIGSAITYLLSVGYVK